jgi:2-polyprenyl-3-methyl-5-hydroxy-6-metoxy-1,4-benzoquinol methylase
MDQSTLKYYSNNAAQVAERYESVVSYLSAHFADSFSKGGKVLDIGCGSGRDLAVLHKLGFDYYGVDPVLEFVEIAKRLHPVLANRIFVFKWVLLFVTVRRCRLIRNSKKSRV